MIKNFEDFCNELLHSGFSLGGGNAKGVYAVIDYDWQTVLPDDNPVRWHTGNPETDPWEWRMRVLEERSDIAYSKLFFNASGYITKEWYPYFISARRQGMDFTAAYESGEISQTAKTVYDIVSGHGAAALHEIKLLGGFVKEDKSRFDKAVTELQMKMFITMCGRVSRKSHTGEEYGWESDCLYNSRKLFRRGLYRQGSGYPSERSRGKDTRTDPEIESVRR